MCHLFIIIGLKLTRWKRVWDHKEEEYRAKTQLPMRYLLQPQLTTTLVNQKLEAHLALKNLE